MINFEPFKSTDAFTMQNFNEKLGGAISQVNSEIQEVKDSAVKIETGSYVGTGTYGKANPNTLTFGFVPKLVIILDPHEYHCPVVMVYGSKLASPSNSSGGNYYLRDITWSKTISWYNLSNAQYQLNDTSGTYYYFAIG